MASGSNAVFVQSGRSCPQRHSRESGTAAPRTAGGFQEAMHARNAIAKGGGRMANVGVGVARRRAVASRIRVVQDPVKELKPQGWTRFVCFSDTHGTEARIPAEHIISADVLLHAGDFTNTGEVSQVKGFARWLASYPATQKVVIAGNHDITFQPDYYDRAWDRFHRRKMSSEEARASLIQSGSCIYLEDESIEVFGHKIFGSPWQPEFCDWAFNYDKLKGREVWEQIPADCDILITHGPPKGVCDLCRSGAHGGCEDLLRAVTARAPAVHLFGHIHSGYGAVLSAQTLFINASTCTSEYEPSNPPFVFDMPPVAVPSGSREARAVSVATAWPEPHGAVTFRV